METEEQRQARVDSENFTALCFFVGYIVFVAVTVIAAIAPHH